MKRNVYFASSDESISYAYVTFLKHDVGGRGILCTEFEVELIMVNLVFM